MRGPLGSLIAQAQHELFQKSASPIAFCQAVPHTSKCMPIASRQDLARNFVFFLTNSRQSVYLRPRGAARSDPIARYRFARYPIG